MRDIDRGGVISVTHVLIELSTMLPSLVVSGIVLVVSYSPLQPARVSRGRGHYRIFAEPKVNASQVKTGVSSHTLLWNSPLVVFVVVFCLVLVTGTIVARELNAKSRPLQKSSGLGFVTDWRELAKVGHGHGQSDAPVRVVLFADYQCAGCAALHALLASAAQTMSGRLRIVTRHFPLSGHPHAVAAANAAECAAEQHRFAEFEDVAYTQQDSIGVLPWSVIGARAGVADSGAFNRCVGEQRYGTNVVRDRAAARALKLPGTPVYIVNGQPHFGAPSLAVLMKHLNEGVNHVR